MGITGESFNTANTCADLDEETMAEVSVSNRMVKAMFESAAPKYKFGGSGSNLNVSSTSKEDLRRKGPVTRPSDKPKEERKWVVDTINKYFEVIVEENDDEEEEENDDFDDLDDDLDSSSEYSEYSEYSDDNDDTKATTTAADDTNTAATGQYKSSTRIRGLLGSVASKFTKSVGNLANGAHLVNNLKKNLGSQISLRNSSLDLRE